MGFSKEKSPWNKGLTKDDPRVAKNSENVSKALKGKPNTVVWTPEMRKAKSEWRKQLHLTNPEMHPNRKLANNRNKISYPERVAYNWMTSNDISFEHHKRIGQYFPDFVIGNLIIEIDGEYWHNEETDRKKDIFFNESGYEVIRIKAKDRIEDKLFDIFKVNNRTALPRQHPVGSEKPFQSA
jgi:very-short-patch-repair endonuclease